MNNNTNNFTNRTNFVPRGKFDRNVYRSPDIDPRTQTIEFLGNFKDNFTVVDDKDINDIDKSGPFGANYSLAPFPIPYSRQIFQPIFENKNPETDNIAHTDKFFKFGDPVFGAHGSNLNAPGSNQHKTPFNENSFLLGLHGPNLNGFTLDQVVNADKDSIPKMETNNKNGSFNDINLLEDSVNKLFENVANTSMQKMIKKVESTHDNNIDKSYNTENNMAQPTKSINEYDFKKDQFLEKNVRGVKEAVYEYIVYINSADRDCYKFPNPFNYRVEFGASNQTTNAYIARYFKNIKYMHLKSVILPRRYAVVNRPTNIINNNTNPDPSNIKFVEVCKATENNGQICTYVRHQGIINYYGTLLYFNFYSMNIDSSYYSICSYNLYSDTEYRQSVDINKLSLLQTTDIDNWILNIYNPNDYVISKIPYILPSDPNISIYLSPNNIPDVNSWILIANTTTTDGGRIKFCEQNDHFNELIKKTYEFSYDTSNNIVLNSLRYYLLLGTSLEDDRYILLNVPEIDTNYEYGTDDNLQRSFSILLPDYINGDYYYLDSTNHEKVFDSGTLGNLSKMTVSYKNAIGNDLNVNNLNIIDYDIKTPNNQCICTYDKLTGERTRDYQCFHSYLRHPSFEKLQNTVILKLGVLEGSQDIQYI